MQWNSIFQPVENMDCEEARAYISKHSAGEYQLLDVRQPKEYEYHHIPGGRLIPLIELPGRLAELDQGKPLIAYCAVGGRSKAAAQYLLAQGFKEVYNLAGGIKAWTGEKAFGPLDQGLLWFHGDEEYPDAIHLAYAMEDGLQQFYGNLAANAKDAKEKTLFEQLAGIEEKHKARLEKECQQKGCETSTLADSNSGVMEGGVTVEEMLQRTPEFTTLEDILEFAMALEAQAYDLYSRMAQISTKESTRALFVSMMDEERAHLNRLTTELNNALNK